MFSGKTPLSCTRLSTGRRCRFHLTGKELHGGRITMSNTGILLLSTAPLLRLLPVFIQVTFLHYKINLNGHYWLSELTLPVSCTTKIWWIKSFEMDHWYSNNLSVFLYKYYMQKITPNNKQGWSWCVLRQAYFLQCQVLFLKQKNPQTGF